MDSLPPQDFNLWISDALTMAPEADDDAPLSMTRRPLHTWAEALVSNGSRTLPHGE